jgi:hypothetical protein
MKAVTDSFGPEGSLLAGEHCTKELDSREMLPGWTGCDWRLTMIAAGSRPRSHHIASNLVHLLFV